MMKLPFPATFDAQARAGAVVALGWMALYLVSRHRPRNKPGKRQRKRKAQRKR